MYYLHFVFYVSFREIVNMLWKKTFSSQLFKVAILRYLPRPDAEGLGSSPGSGHV